MKRKKKAYLDGAANTPLEPRVLAAMKPYLSVRFCGNSRSAHEYGAAADQAVFEARKSIAEDMSLQPDEIFFTSGATESNNWVIKGLALHELEKPVAERRMDIICSPTEHASVLEACKSLEPLGFKIAYFKVGKRGEIFPKDVEIAMHGKNVLLVCCMAVNNETGVYNDVDAIALQVHKGGALLLSDFTQAFSSGGGALSVGTKYPRVDYITMSGHKIYGPTGTGLLIRRHAPLYPLLSGGAQEKGLRGGTHNVAGIVGLAKAIHIARTEPALPLLTNKRNALFEHIVDRLGERDASLIMWIRSDTPSIVSLSAHLLLDLPNLAIFFANYGVAVSAGAACSAGEEGEQLSHVLLALGKSERYIRNTVRISLTKYTKDRELDLFAKALADIIDTYRKED